MSTLGKMLCPVPLLHRARFVPVVVLLLAGLFFASPVRGQSPMHSAVTAAQGNSLPWEAQVGDQLRASLQSRNGEVQFLAIQDVIALESLYPGRFDLTATVPALLRVYESSSKPGHRIAAVHALYLVGDSAGLAELGRLSAEDDDPFVKRTARKAVGLHFITLEIERHEALAQRSLANGNAKKADRHVRRAEWYRSRLS